MPASRIALLAKCRSSYGCAERQVKRNAEGCNLIRDSELLKLSSMTLHCVGFVRERDRAQAWIPCGRPRLEGDRLCKRHRDAMDGAVIGLIQARVFGDDPNKTKQAGRGRGKRS